MALTKTNATANTILSHSISYNIKKPKGDNTTCGFCDANLYIPRENSHLQVL